MPITTDGYLYLSGTPFRAIASGEFIEEQIFNWTYSDEQRAKQDWKGADNPYAALPRMVLLTYQLPDAIREIAMQGEFNEFDLNVFFSAEGIGDKAKFKYERRSSEVAGLIRGAFMPTSVDNLKLGAQKPPMPFSDVRLLNVLSHTFWFLPSVASCHAMRNLLAKKQNRFYHDYQVVVAAGSAAGIGVGGLPPVKEAMDDPLKTKTITLSCGKLTTGVTVKPWTGILMLRNSLQPGNLFSGRLPGAVAVDGQESRQHIAQRGADHQGGVLRLRFRAGPGLAADRRLQLPPECERIQSREEGGGVHQFPARPGL